VASSSFWTLAADRSSIEALGSLAPRSARWLANPRTTTEDRPSGTLSAPGRGRGTCPASTPVLPARCRSLALIG